MGRRVLKPAEILNYTIAVAKDKADGGFKKLVILSFFAGAFIAFASEGSNMAAFNLLAEPATYGLGKALAGAIFGTGLMLVILAGGELFTGNTLILTAVLEKEVSWSKMLRNWAIVYGGNLLGSVFIAYLMVNSGLFSSGGDMLGAVTLRIATYKVNLGFAEGFYLGIMCNWLVCLAVWMSYGADGMAGKILAIFFPIWLFITSGFEHSVANMYYIPAGILAKTNPNFVMLAGLYDSELVHLSWVGFLINNLIPVTLGNIVGGGLFVGMSYWYVYRKA